MIRALFLLPVRDNDGRPLADEIAEVEEACFREFGAWSQGGYFRGAWKMKNGERAIDTSVVYLLYLEPEQIPPLRAILRRFKGRTTQEAILLELTSAIDIELV